MAPRASKFDPYRTFKFRLRVADGAGGAPKTVAGVTKVSALGRTVTPNDLKEGGDFLGARQNPGMVTYDDVTLEWGLSADRTFEEWANAVTRLHQDPAGVSHFKRTVFIDVYDLASNPQDRASRPVLSYKLHRCWVTKYVALPELNADSGGVGIQSVTLRHEGFERV